jgi:hypothetical protein
LFVFVQFSEISDIPAKEMFDIAINAATMFRRWLIATDVTKATGSAAPHVSRSFFELAYI